MGMHAGSRPLRLMSVGSTRAGRQQCAAKPSACQYTTECLPTPWGGARMWMGGQQWAGRGVLQQAVCMKTHTGAAAVTGKEDACIIHSSL